MSEIDERMRNWRTDRIAEYAKLEAVKQQIQTDMNLDGELNKIETSIKSWLERADKLKKPYFDRTTKCEQQQTGIKSELVETWGSTEDKTFECTAGTATLRTTKSLHIRSKEKLVAFLELNKKLTDFINSVEITKLRKIKDAGMLGDDIATWDKKKNVAIKIAEVDQ